MTKKLLLAVLALAFIAAPASAAVQNVQISGSVDNMYLHRSNFDFGKQATSGDEVQNLFITYTTLRVDADLTDQVSATVGLINERAWENNTTSGVSNVNVYLAYATLREMLYSPLTVILGRQVWSYGNGLVFDATGPNTSANGDSGLSSIAGDLTKQSALDAIRFILDYNPLTIEGFFSQVTPSASGALSDTDDSVNIWGLNATYEVGDEMNSVVEGYFFARKDKNTDSSGTLVDQLDTLKIVGGRISTNPLEGVSTSVEVAHQSGRRVNPDVSDLRRDRDAWAFQAGVNYQVPMMEEYNPVLGYRYTKLTGDNDPADDKEYNAWDPFFEGQHGGTIFNSLFSLSNLRIHEVSLTLNPMEDVTTTIKGSKLYLDKAYRPNSTFSLLQPDGTAATVTPRAGDKELGTEIDVITTYDYTEDVQFGLNVGVFKPGDVLSDGDQVTAKQVLANVNVAF